MILILLAIGILISGVALRSTPLFVSSIFINIAALICFKVGWEYQPLVLGTVSIIAVAIPGFIMRSNYKKRQTQKAIS